MATSSAASTCEKVPPSSAPTFGHTGTGSGQVRAAEWGVGEGGGRGASKETDRKKDERRIGRKKDGKERRKEEIRIGRNEERKKEG